VIISSVTPGGPAEKGGLKEHDIIVSIDGRNIKDGDDLVSEIASRRPGSSVRLGYIREGKPADATVTIGDRDKIFAETDKAVIEKDHDEQVEPGEAKLGIVVHELSTAASSKLKLSGVAIASVRSGSFADLEGLAPGLVIIRINRQPTGTKAAYDAIVSKLKTGDDVVFEIIDPRNPSGGTNYIGGTLQ
jgi:serine protease Do